MPVLTKEQILARRLPWEAVDIGDGQTIGVRGMSHATFFEMNQRENDPGFDEDVFVALNCVVDQSGDPVFDCIDDAKDFAANNRTEVLTIIKMNAIRLSRAPDDVQELVKKSLPNQDTVRSGE